MTTLEQAASAALVALDDMIERVVFLAGERDPVAPSVVARAAADALREALAAQPTRPLGQFDAVDRAMDMASLLAGSVAMNNVAQAEVYSARLRSHLVEYIYPQQATHAQQAFGIIDPDYARIFTQARIVAWQYGYACLAHGSFTRDLDLLLVPWSERTGTGAPVDPKGIVHRIADVCGLKVQGEPSDKPHGRKAWSLLLAGFSEVRWVDVSAIAPDASAPAALTKAAADVLAERRRQVEAEGWTPEHDDDHVDGEIPHAAACYALMAGGTFAVDPLWPKTWGPMKAKPHRQMLVVAAALLLAEIERLDRIVATAAKLATSSSEN